MVKSMRYYAAARNILKPALTKSIKITGMKYYFIQNPLLKYTNVRNLSTTFTHTSQLGWCSTLQQWRRRSYNECEDTDVCVCADIFVWAADIQYWPVRPAAAGARDTLLV